MIRNVVRLGATLRTVTLAAACPAGPFAGSCACAGTATAEGPSNAVALNVTEVPVLSKLPSTSRSHRSTNGWV